MDYMLSPFATGAVQGREVRRQGGERRDAEGGGREGRMRRRKELRGKWKEKGKRLRFIVCNGGEENRLFKGKKR